MSTTPEVIAAVHMGARVIGISCISNAAAGLGEKPLSHEEVKETAELVGPQFEKLLLAVVTDLAKKESL
jgi:purine-nucleoside phosphorylase